MFVNLKYNFPCKWSTISCSVILNSSVNNISPPMESTRRGVTSALFSVELHNQGVNSEDGKVLCARRADVIHTLEQVREMQVALFVACGCNWIKQREKDLLFECTSAQNNHDPTSLTKLYTNTSVYVSRSPSLLSSSVCFLLLPRSRYSCAHSSTGTVFGYYYGQGNALINPLPSRWGLTFVTSGCVCLSPSSCLSFDMLRHSLTQLQ